MENGCRGCVSFDRIIELCSAGISDPKHCPCIKCLVKTMCNTACEDFQDHKSWCRAKVNGNIKGY